MQNPLMFNSQFSILIGWELGIKNWELLEASTDQIVQMHNPEDVAIWSHDG